MSKTLGVVLLVFGLVSDVQAQDPRLYLSSQREPVRVTVGALYQQYTQDEVALSELSIPLMLSAPLGNGLGLTLVAHQASAKGDTLASFNGVTDVQVGLSYARRFSAGTLMLNVGTNLPSGKQELTLEEFQTAALLSQHYYLFQVPGFGQGFNVAPGFVWAFAVSDRVAAGVGATYQYRGTYRPLSVPDATYDPGDEIVLTAGLDVRTGSAINLSADAFYTLYGSDTFGDEEIIEAGDKLVVTVQLTTRVRQGDLRILARHRTIAKSSRPGALDSPSVELQLLPTQTLIRGTYRRALTDAVALGVLGQMRIYGENVVFESASLFDVGLTPEVILTQGVTAYAQGGVTFGDFTGVEAGGGLRLEL